MLSVFVFGLSRTHHHLGFFKDCGLNTLTHKKHTPTHIHTHTQTHTPQWAQGTHNKNVSENKSLNTNHNMIPPLFDINHHHDKKYDKNVPEMLSKLGCNSKVVNKRCLFVYVVIADDIWIVTALLYYSYHGNVTMCQYFFLVVPVVKKRIDWYCLPISSGNRQLREVENTKIKRFDSHHFF